MRKREPELMGLGSRLSVSRAWAFWSHLEGGLLLDRVAVRRQAEGHGERGPIFPQSLLSAWLVLARLHGWSQGLWPHYFLASGQCRSSCMHFNNADIWVVLYQCGPSGDDPRFLPCPSTGCACPPSREACLSSAAARPAETAPKGTAVSAGRSALRGLPPLALSWAPSLHLAAGFVVC